MSMSTRERNRKIKSEGKAQGKGLQVFKEEGSLVPPRKGGGYPLPLTFICPLLGGLEAGSIPAGGLGQEAPKEVENMARTDWIAKIKNSKNNKHHDPDRCRRCGCLLSGEETRWGFCHECDRERGREILARYGIVKEE